MIKRLVIMSLFRKADAKPLLHYQKLPEYRGSYGILDIFSAVEMEELLKDLQVLNPEQRKRLESLSITRQLTDSTSTSASSAEKISSKGNISVEQQVGFL